MFNSPNRFGGLRLILYGLLVVLALASIYVSRNKPPPEWTQCKESLIEQFFSDQCTPTTGFGQEIIIPPSPGQNT